MDCPHVFTSEPSLFSLYIVLYIIYDAQQESGTYLSEQSNMNSSSEKPSSSALKLLGFPLTASGSDEAPIHKDAGMKIECPLCDRKFHSFQALGGHQNAHRRERKMAMLTQLQYMHPRRQHRQMFQAAGAQGPAPSVLPSVPSPTDAYAVQSAVAPKLPAVEPQGTRNRNAPAIVQVPVVGVDDIDLELRLATSTMESGR